MPEIFSSPNLTTFCFLCIYCIYRYFCFQDVIFYYLSICAASGLNLFLPELYCIAFFLEKLNELNIYGADTVIANRITGLKLVSADKMDQSTCIEHVTS